MMRWFALVILALILAACGDDQQQAQQQTPTRTAADTTAAPVASPALEVPGQVRHHPEGGFSIYWPAGCNRITISESGRQTRRAEREVIFSCVGPDASYSVRKLEMAHDVHGNPAHPRLVVSLIEEQLHLKTMSIVRQRPLEQGAIQGVDVHAEGKDTRQRAWYRGLLVGHDIFLFMVIGEAPGLFEHVETHDFLNSFQLD